MLTIRGQKGKKPKTPSPRTPIETPNTLQSKNTARIIDGLCEGPVKGLINNLQSVYLDGTPLENADGTKNFQGVTIEFKAGEPDQTALSGFPFVENEVDVGVRVLKDNPITRSIADTDIDALRLKIRLPSLTLQNLTTGNLVGAEVEFKIEVQPSGGTYLPISQMYAWASMTGTQTNVDAVGLKVTVSKTLSGLAGTTQSGVVTVEYRAVGDISWTVLGTRTLSATMPTSNSTVVSATFEETGWTPDQYEYRITSGTLTLAEQGKVGTLKLSGKTTSPYEISYRFDLPGNAPWNIRVTRVTADSQAATLNNDMYWSTYTTIIDAKLSYPHTALIGVTVDAEEFGNEVPERGYDGEWLIIRVPSNYDPDTREYTGIWDGTFQLAYSNNPAWVLYDMLVSNRYGCGKDIDVDQIDKFALYDIGQYCDELVDDGFGAQEPRFTFNGVMTSQREAFDVINALTSAFRGMAYWGTGAVTVTQDAPADPVKLVTNANVIGGDFEYSSSGLKARHSVVFVTWNDPGDNYRAAIEVVEDPEMITAIGWNKTDTVAFGCTSRGQARRFGKWILDSERYETDTVNYKASFDHLDVRPGDIIAIADSEYAGVEYGGRLKTPGTGSLVLDRPITLLPGHSYTVSVEMPDRTIEDRAVTNVAGETDTLSLAVALPDTPLVNALWVVTGTDVSPRLFRVIWVRELEKHIYEISALFHDPGKFARVEDGSVLDAPNYSAFPTGPLLPVSDITVQEYLYEAGPAVKSAVTISWLPPHDARVGFYEVFYKGPSDPEYRYLDTVSGTSVNLEDTNKGVYQFKIRAMSGLGGLRSQPVEASFDLQGLLAKPADVQNFNLQIVGSQAYLSWDSVPDLDLKFYVLKYSALTVGATWATAIDLVPEISKNLNSIAIQALTGTYLIKAQDTSGEKSENEALVVSTIGELANLNVIEILTEEPTFSGLDDDTAVIEGFVRLAAADTVDDWDDVDGISNVDVGAHGLVSEGYKYFVGSGLSTGASIDLGEVYTSRVTALIQALGSDLFSNVDDWVDVDAVENVDGAAPSNWSVTPQLRYTSDDPDVAPNWSAWANLVMGDYTARAFQFRLKLASFESHISPMVSNASIQIDMPDRVDGGNDIVCIAAGQRVTYSPAFKAPPSVGIAAQGMQDGDRCFIDTNTKDETGFDIRFFDNTGTGIQRTFDWVAKGYGKQAP